VSPADGTPGPGAGGDGAGGGGVAGRAGARPWRLATVLGVLVVIFLLAGASVGADPPLWLGVLGAALLLVGLGGEVRGRRRARPAPGD
jgi:hypothetical protein